MPLVEALDSNFWRRLGWRKTYFILLVILAPVLGQVRCHRPGVGKLELSVIDEATGQPTPARVELLDADGKAYVANEVYVTVQGRSQIGGPPRAKVVARKWLAYLENLEARLAEGELSYLAADAASTPGDLDADYIRRNRTALLEAIHEAREHFAKLVR